MTIESAKEQSKAGLDEMTFDEKLQMENLNSRYKEKFGFPFVTRDDYVSKSSAVFHDHNALQLRRMEMLLYKNIDEECQ